MYVLDKLVFIRRLSIDVPSCVLSEIAQNRSVNVNNGKLESLVYRANVFSIIETTPPVSVTYPLCGYDLTEVAAFLNPETEWPLSSLVKAFEIVWNKYWSRSPTQDLVTSSSSYGFPSPSNMDSISPVVAYTILKSMGVSLSHEDTFECMVYTLKLTLLSKHSVVREMALSLPMLKSNILLSMAMRLKPNARDSPKIGNINRRITKLLTNKRYVGSSFVPFTDGEAVAASIVFYGVDISSSTSPLAEYSNMALSRERYDNNMRELERANPLVFDTRHTFNPSLPVSAYELSSLKSMCVSVGVSLTGKKRTLADYHNALMTEHATSRFHNGVLPGTKSLETSVYMTDLREDQSPRVSYGSTADRYVAYTVAELTDMFRSNMHFYNPVTGESFSRESVRGLRSMCVTEGWGELIEVIDIVTSLFPGLEILRESLASFVDAKKNDMRDLLYYLLYSGLRMRGWDGVSEKWPVREVSTVAEADAQALLVTEYLSKVLEKGREMRELGEYVLSLPLLYVRKGGREVYINTDADRGLTIQARINIVVTNASIHACTRTSSNYFLITSFYYLSALGISLPYSPSDVRLIG